MSSSSKAIAAQRRLQFEQFEQRLVMSAQAIAPAIIEALPELAIAAPAITGQEVVLQQNDLTSTANTQAAEIASQYGLDGSGQTVAVIDSGIAWDHNAFGNGFGEGRHVVGGWDFAENDANPYDDGPAGYHGSHVAGIIGSLDETYRGVSSGSDLVSLRVFDDNGAGKLEWLEQALQWVIDHHDDFEHPITTVNLSLGTGWDPATTPGWGLLDNEFAQLKDMGIFTSVAAGNAFHSINDVGLSYPAASEHVVPVASHDGAGQLSDFSQRDEGVLVAPGEMLRSPVPNHLFGGTETDRFLASSGTSMAAPYVAGVAALIRQANLFMGQTNVNQDLIYDQLVDTSDRVFDHMTNRYFNKIDLSAALDHVIQDRHEQSLANATDLGTMQEGESIIGTIGRLDDIDAIRFTAAQSGRVNLTVTATHSLTAEIETLGDNLSIDGNVISFDVVAGQSYGFKVSTTSGTGHYDIGIDYQENATVVTRDLGVIAADSFSNLPVRGEAIYQMTPIRDGILTLQANVTGTSVSNVSMDVYDAQMNLVTSQKASNDGTFRLDANVLAGKDYFIKFSNDGNLQHLDLSVTNLVSVEQGRVSVHGTAASDQLTVQQTNTGSTSDARFTINEVDYQFSSDQVSQVNFFGHQGEDSIAFELSDLDDRVATRTNDVGGSNGVYIGNRDLIFNAYSFDNLSIDGQGGYDTVLMRDSHGADQFSSRAQNGTHWTELQGNDFQSRVANFEIVHAVSHGSDKAYMVGSEHDDVFVARGNRNVMRLADSAGAIEAVVLVDHFDSVVAEGGGGQDRTNLFDRQGNDTFDLSPTSASVTGQGYRIEVSGFEQINAFSSQGEDLVQIRDSTGDDYVSHRHGITTVHGDGFGLYASGFGQVELISVGGFDVGQIYDSQWNDHFYSASNYASLTHDNFQLTATGIENIGFTANEGGIDRATVKGSDAVDRLNSNESTTRVDRSNGEVVRVANVEATTVDLLAGLDHAQVYGSQGRDRLEFNDQELTLETTLRMLRLVNAEQTQFDGVAGKDSVNAEGKIDLLSAIGDQARVVLQEKQLMMENFGFLEASNVDSALADYDLESVDFTYMLRGAWESQ